MGGGGERASFALSSAPHNDERFSATTDYAETPSSQRKAGASLEDRHRMSAKLSQLPRPQNDFELILPEDEDEAMKEEHVSAEFCLQSLS